MQPYYAQPAPYAYPVAANNAYPRPAYGPPPGYPGYMPPRPMMPGMPIPGMPMPPMMAGMPPMMPPRPMMPGMPPMMPMPMMPGAPPMMAPMMMPNAPPLMPGMLPGMNWPPNGGYVSNVVLNPACTNSLTIFVGNIPPKLDDDTFLNGLFSVFGKVLKWNRPVDKEEKQKLFGFLTFEQGVCAWKCMNVLSHIDLNTGNIAERDKSTGAEDMNAIDQNGSEEACKLVLRAGTKELSLLDSINKVIIVCPILSVYCTY